MISRMTVAEFEEAKYFEQGIPAIVVDALESWNVSEHWTPAHLGSIAGDREVTVALTDKGKYAYNDTTDAAKRFAYREQSIPFAEALRTICDDLLAKHFYILQQSIRQKLPELLSELTVPRWIQRQELDINLWLGRDTSGPLHYDYLNNFFAQAHGTKRFVICSPQDTAYVYPYRCDAFMSHCSHVDVNQPDWDKHPEFARATPVNFELQAGDLLFLPAFWWHQVEGNGLSISVSFWWQPTAAQFFQSPNSARDLPRLYDKDRLSNFKRTCLAPAQYDFLTAADVLLQQGRTWGAGMLGLAAFDELLSSLQHKSRASGCLIADLSKDLEQTWAEVGGTIALPQQQRQLLASIPEIAQQAAYCDDTRLERAAAATVFEAVTTLKRAIARAA